MKSLIILSLLLISVNCLASDDQDDIKYICHINGQTFLTDNSGECMRMQAGV